MTRNEKTVRALIERWAAAVRVGDMDAILAKHTDDVVMFDVPEPLQSKGIDAYRATWELFFRYSPGGPGSFDIAELDVTVGDDVGFATGILTIMGSPLRLTVGLRREDGEWRIAHEHHSYAAKLDG